MKSLAQVVVLGSVIPCLPAQEAGWVDVQVDYRGIPRAPSNRIELVLVRPAGEFEGELRQVRPDATGRFRIDNLVSGKWELALAANDEKYNVFHAYADVEVRAGEGVEATMRVPAGTAALLVRSKDNPPYALALFEPGVEVADEDITSPRQMQALQRLLGQKTHARPLVYGAHGSSDEKLLRRMPAGRFIALVVANDWQPGDPPIRPRTVAIEFRAGEVTELHLEDKLQRLRVKSPGNRVPLRRGGDLFLNGGFVLHDLRGEAAGDQFGWVARVIGDVDADGALDFATSAPTKRIDGTVAGRVYAYSGRTGELLFTRDGRPGERLGFSIAGAGDVNDDGIADFVAGAPGEGVQAGAAYVLSGRDGATLSRLGTGEAGDRFGSAVCGLGDVNGDGHTDLAVAAIAADTPAGKGAGRVTLFSGRSGRVLLSLDGQKPGGNFGSALGASADDHRLLVVGAMNEGTDQRGRVHVYRLSATSAKERFLIDAAETGRDLGRFFVSVLGDIDGDGVPDVFASDFADAGKGRNTGRVVVHSGADGARLLDLQGHAGEGFGTSLAVAGDVNGDGRADLVVGARQNSDGGRMAGKCYLFSGVDGSQLSSWTCLEPGDAFGSDAVGIGDVNGDEKIDFLFSSAWSEVVGPRTGRVLVLTR